MASLARKHRPSHASRYASKKEKYLGGDLKLIARIIDIELHEKYGRLVRIGPNQVLVSDSEATRFIYRPSTGLVKTSFYDVQSPMIKGRRRPQVFSQRDEHKHGLLKRMVSPAYSMQNLKAMEHLRCQRPFSASCAGILRTRTWLSIWESGSGVSSLLPFLPSGAGGGYSPMLCEGGSHST